MATNNKYNLVSELKKADEKFDKSLALMGKTMLTQFTYNSGGRNIMFTSHLSQFVNLTNPQHPRVRTTAEPVVGDNSTGYCKVKNDTVLYKRINKFDDIVDEPLMSLVFLYDKVKDEYSVKTIQACENLTEHYGYKYNNDEINKYKEGDVIPANTVIYKSSSYDEYNNYGYGTNIMTLYTTDARTHEDACVISETASKKLLKSIEAEDVIVGVNMNDVLINLYGELNNHKSFPDIGEFTNGIICTKRTIFRDQFLSDFTDKALTKINESDISYYSKGKVIDIDVYCNNTELEDSPYNNQILNYLNSEKKFYKQVKKVCKEIMKSGSKYDRDVDYLYKKASLYIDDDRKWKLKDNTFNNIVIKFTILREVDANIGQKITGRSGNKSVVSTILPDDQMPYYYDDNGNKVTIHLMKNILEIVNRTIGFPLFEMQINYITGKVRSRLSQLKTLKEKEKLLFDILKIFNAKQHKEIKDIYDGLSTSDKKEFMKSCVEDGIYIDWPPMWEDKLMIHKIEEILDKYDFLKPYDIYYNLDGREVKCIYPVDVGEMYIMKLKQSAKKNYSAREMGSVNLKGLPDRNNHNKTHIEPSSSKPIREGEYETLTYLVATPSEEAIAAQIFFRTSVDARRDLKSLLLKNKFSLDSIKLDLKKKYTSRSAEIYNVILKSLGLGVDFDDGDIETVAHYDDNEIKVFQHGDRTFIATEYAMHLAERRLVVEDDVLYEFPIIETSSLNKEVDERLKDKEEK